MGDQKLPKIARETGGARKIRARQPIEWANVLKELDISEKDTLANELLGGCKKEVVEWTLS